MGPRTPAENTQIMRTGVGFDKVHPMCSVTVTKSCLPPPFKGELPKIMPWPANQSITDHDLDAVYEYLMN